MTILEKIRNLPESKRKIIFWLIMVLIGLGLIFIYFISIQRNIKNFKSLDLKEKLKIPNLGEELKDWPKLEMPKINEEELKKIEEEIKKNEEKEGSTSTEEGKATTSE